MIGRRLTALLLVAAALAVAAHQYGRPALPSTYRVTVRSFDGAMGVIWTTTVTPQEVVLVETDDFGSAPRVRLRRPVGEASQEIAARAAGLRLDRLEDRYHNPNVCDGLQLTVGVDLPGQPPRTIEVANTYIAELAGLTNAVDRLLPEEYRVGYDMYRPRGLIGRILHGENMAALPTPDELPPDVEDKP